jgi:hypothetical protein
MKKTGYILLNAFPILVMIGLIPLVKNDYLLVIAYLVLIVVSLTIHREPKDLIIFALGLVALTISEIIFVSTGVEVFARNSLLNLMPIWLPVLWGYGFIVIKRAVIVL